eukprot:9464768-Lingulodinium_polyedra.AAC.1
MAPGWLLNGCWLVSEWLLTACSEETAWGLQCETLAQNRQPFLSGRPHRRRTRPARTPPRSRA